VGGGDTEATHGQATQGTSAEQQQNGMVSSTGIVNDLAAMARRIVLAITDIVAIIASDRISPVATYN
jgi:hypothetical protein